MEKLQDYIDKNKKEHELKSEYEAYNNRVKLNNTFFQSFRVQDNLIDKDKSTPGNTVYKPNPENVFRFYYRPFRTRNYKVNYIDDRGKKKIEDFFKGLELANTSGLTGDDLLAANTANKGKFEANRDKLEKILDNYKVIDKEDVTSQCRHYDARNYRQIPGWTLVGKPQQQLFYDVNEKTNEFLGINGTGSDEIYFYYKDTRVIEVKKDDPTPKGYVRVTFKIDDKNNGGVFKDKDGKEVTELHYDVIKGLKSDNLPLPIIWKEGEKDSEGKPLVKEENRYYITPDQGKTFKEWNNEKWLNKETEINKNYTFTAYFNWSGLTSSGLVRTEAFKDPNNKWTNDFAPKIEDLKKQLVWKEKDEVKSIPDGTTITLVDENNNELTKDNHVYELVKELNKKDKDEVVRLVNIKAKVKFKDGTETQELDIPITVYKNRYEALNENGDKPEYLLKAEGKEAKDGGLKDVTGNYVMVTVSPSGEMKAKDNKVYYVNPKAWVEIPEVSPDGSSTFINWTADKVGQNDDGKKKGKFDFKKRHKFTEDTMITPVGAGDVVEQQGKDKPDVPKSYVKVIVKTTDNATDESKFEKTFWVNPTKEVNIGVTNPTGKTVAADSTKPGTVGYKMDFFNWKSEETTPRTWKDKIIGKFERETIIIAKYSVEFEKIKETEPTKGTIDVPKGKIPTADEIKNKLTPPEGKTISKVKIVENPNVNTPGESKVQVIVEYTDGSSVGTSEKPIEIPVQVHDNIIPEVFPGQKPEGAMDNYVKVTFTAGKGGKLEGTLTYYVSPDVEADFTEIAGNKITKTPDVGYISGSWDTSETKKLKDIFKSDAEFTFNFTKNANVVEKTGDPNQEIPKGYVTVTFKTNGNGKVNGADKKIYFVNPTAEIKLVELQEGQKANEKQLQVPTPTPNKNYVFVEWQEAIDQTTSITGDREYVAMFADGQVTLTYDAGGAIGNVPGKATINVGKSLRLARADNLSKQNSVFKGWKIGNDIYQPGNEVTLTEDTTAIAQWKSSAHKVTFNTMGGSAVAEQEVEHGKTLTNVATPTLNGKVFMGWKEKETDTTYFDLNTPINENKTLIAIWQDSVQKINDGEIVEPQFIKVTFLKGSHGTLKDGQTKDLEKVTYKVAKDLKDVKGLNIPDIVPAKYYKTKSENDGWDKVLELNGQDVEFTAQYQPIADVIPVDPKVTDDIQIKKEIPDDMILVEFVVPKGKAFMTGNTKFYVKKDTLVDIETPVVHRLTLPGNQPNPYSFNGWKFQKDLATGKYLFKFNENTQIEDGKVVKPEITIRNPRPNANNVIIKDLTAKATGYLEVYRGTNPPVYIKSSSRGRLNLFKIPDELGGKLNKNDRIRMYSKLNGVESDIREYRVR